jgi:hypothetical protein
VPTKNLIDLVAWLEDLFESHGVRRSYGGAIARNFYAIPRLTRVIDVLVLASQLQFPSLVEELRKAGASALRVDTGGDEVSVPLDLRAFLEDLKSGARMTRVLCFGVRLELFAPWHPFDHEVLRRALEKDFGERKIRIHSPEDLIIYKTAFGRSKDHEDIKAMLAANAGTLDLTRIREGAARLLDATGVSTLEALIRDYYAHQTEGRA